MTFELLRGCLYLSDKVFTHLHLKWLLILGVITLFPLTQVSAEVVWEEDWEHGPPFDEWIFQAYSYNEVDGFQPNASAAPAVVDGVFKTNALSALFGYWGAQSGAYRNSSVAYGTWSFDWIIEPGVEHESYVNVFFITNKFHEENITGNFAEISHYPNSSGYFLNLQSSPAGPFSTARIRFEQFGTGRIVSQSYNFAGSISGTYHIDITRSPDGQFYVYLNYVNTSTQPIISIKETIITTSETFGFGAWFGDSGIDNISIDNEVVITRTTTATTTTTADGGPGFQFEVLVLSLALLFVTSRKRRS